MWHNSLTFVETSTVLTHTYRESCHLSPWCSFWTAPASTLLEQVPSPLEQIRVSLFLRCPCLRGFKGAPNGRPPPFLAFKGKLPEGKVENYRRAESGGAPRCGHELDGYGPRGKGPAQGHSAGWVPVDMSGVPSRGGSSSRTSYPHGRVPIWNTPPSFPVGFL